MANRKKVTQKKKIEFLENLRKTANVTISANACNVRPKTFYYHRAIDSDFATEWDDAVNEAIDAMEENARARAFEGIEKPVYQGGELVGFTTEYSDTLAIFLLKAHRPEKYRERSTVELTGDAIKVTWNNLEQITNAGEGSDD